MMAYLQLWWVWLAIAMVLGIVEILAPGFVFLGIALGATILAVLMLLLPGVISGLGLSALLAVFAVLSVFAWFVLRFAFRRQSSGAQVFTDDVND